MMFLSCCSHQFDIPLVSGAVDNSKHIDGTFYLPTIIEYTKYRDSQS